jgi:uncharacterized protein YjfI (DUF2170 family)
MRYPESRVQRRVSELEGALKLSTGGRRRIFPKSTVAVLVVDCNDFYFFHFVALSQNNKLLTTLVE